MSLKGLTVAKAAGRESAISLGFPTDFAFNLEKSKIIVTKMLDQASLFVFNNFNHCLGSKTFLSNTLKNIYYLQ